MTSAFTLTGSKQIALKDPQAKLDYTVDWTAWLTDISDTIASVTWTLDSGITKTLDTHDTMTATIWITGGTAGQTYSVVCEITTAGGRIDDRTFYLKIKDQ